MTSCTPITLSFFAVIPVLAIAACASTNSDPHAELDRTFREIQVHEAGIELNRATLARAHATCCEQCGASTRAMLHAEHVCQLARSAADVDALSRCDQAERTSSGITAGARARCQCSSD